MKRMLLAVLLLTLVAMPLQVSFGQEATPGPLAIVAMGSGWVDKNIDRDGWGAGFKLGGQVTLDSDRDWTLRTVYTRMSFGNGPEVGSVAISGLNTWGLGKKWDLYITYGAEAYTEGPFTGSDFFGGIGTARTLWTGPTEGLQNPMFLKGFIELTGADAETVGVSSYLQVNVGITLSKPVKLPVIQ